MSTVGALAEADKWLAQIASLNVYRAKHGVAPHKPLLLLVLLDLAEKQELQGDILGLTLELSFSFDSFWRVVAHRRTQPPDVRFPFHHLGADGFWTAFTESGERSKHRQLTNYVVLNPGFRNHASDATFRNKARKILIAKYFEPVERNALYHLLGMRIPDDELAHDNGFEVPKDAVKAGREARFRLDVVPAYGYACALTGYRVTTIGMGTIVDAAHVHPFSDSRNNSPRNGIALCKNAHWLFDNGLWSITDDYQIITASGQFDETSPDQKSLSDYEGQQLRLPNKRALWPDPKHLAWHRKHRFHGSIRT